MYFLYSGWAEPLLWVIAEDNTAVVKFLLSTQYFCCVVNNISVDVVLMNSNVFPIFRVGRAAAVGGR
jgi:hypothetical protein